MAKTARAGNGITEGVIWKQLLLYFFPILFGSFFQQLYNTTDAVIVGNFVGKEALAAVGGSTGTLINHTSPHPDPPGRAAPIRPFPPHPHRNPWDFV